MESVSNEFVRKKSLQYGIYYWFMELNVLYMLIPKCPSIPRTDTSTWRLPRGGEATLKIATSKIFHTISGFY